MNVADQLTVLSRTQIERRGRWRSFRRSLSAVIGMIVILTPLYLTCAAVLPTVADMPSSVPARIVLLLEVSEGVPWSSDASRAASDRCCIRA